MKEQITTITLDQLRQIEWSFENSNGRDSWYICPVCRKLENNGVHESRCWIGIKISEFKSKRRSKQSILEK